MSDLHGTSELLLFVVLIAGMIVGARHLIHLAHWDEAAEQRRWRRIFSHIRDRVDFPRGFLDPSVVALPSLKGHTWREVLYRFKFTAAMLFLNVYTYVFTTDLSSGDVDPKILENLGFSYANFAAHKWFVLMTCNFIHFNLPHLVSNMAMLVAFSGSLELLKGSTAAAIVYLVSMNSDIPNGLFLLPAVKLFYPSMWHDTYSYLDVGASLGILGSLGGLARLLKPKARWTLMVLAVVGTLVGMVALKTLFGLDHAFSAMIGYLTVGQLLKTVHAVRQRRAARGEHGHHGGGHGHPGSGHGHGHGSGHGHSHRSGHPPRAA